MRSRALGSVLAAVALGGTLSVAGSATAGTGTTYYGASRTGDLVRVTVANDKASPPTVVRKGNPETDQLSPAGSDGGVVVGLDADIDAATTTLFTLDTATGTVHDLSALGSHIESAAIYAHGTRVAYSEHLKQGSVIRSVPATGGASSTVWSSKAWRPWDIAVSENGKHVFFAAAKKVYVAATKTHSQVSGVFRVTSAGAKRLEPKVAAPLFYTQLALSPDGSQLAVVKQKVSGSPRTGFSLVTVRTGHVRTVLKGYGNPISGIAWTADAGSLVFRDANSWGRVTMDGVLWAIARTSKLTAPVLAGS